MSRPCDDLPHVSDIRGVVYVKVCSFRGLMTLDVLSQALGTCVSKSIYFRGLVAIDVMSQALETCVSESMYISRPSEDRQIQ